MIRQCNKKFRTKEELTQWMQSHTGLIASEYKVHTQGVLLPEGMYITFANRVHAVDTLDRMVNDGWFVGDEVSNTDGPIAITC